MGAPVAVDGGQRGVLVSSSPRPEFFAEGDLRFLEAVARWVGLVGHRALLIEHLGRGAAEEGFRAAAAEVVESRTPASGRWRA